MSPPKHLKPSAHPVQCTQSGTIPGNQSPHDHVGRVWVFMCYQSYLMYLRTGLAATMAGKKGESAAGLEYEGPRVVVRRGRSSRNHSRENKHQIAYAQRPRPGGYGPLVGPTRHAAVFFFAADTDRTPLQPFQSRASPPTATCLSAQSVKGDRASRRITRRQGPGKATATRSFSLFPIVCLSRSSLAPQLST